MRIIDDQRIETECESCCVTFTTDRDEDGWPAQTLCSLCSETLRELKQAMMAEMEHVRRALAPRCQHCDRLGTLGTDLAHESKDCPYEAAARIFQAEERERDRVWLETFLSFPFKQLPAPNPWPNPELPCEYCGDPEHHVSNCPDLRDYRDHQDLMDAADQAAYYSPEWEKQ